MAKNKTAKRPAPKSESAPLIIQQLVIKPPRRRVFDVGDWRSALQAADNGRIKQLYDLYDDILIDGVLSDAVQKRIDAVTNSELSFQDSGGKVVPEIARLIDSTAWETLLTEIIKTRIFGRSGFEINCKDGFHVSPIPPKHINLSRREILINDSDDTGESYDGNNLILVLGHERDWGLLLKAAPYAIYKRGGFGDWSQWIELFGMPQRVGKYNTYDPTSRKLLEEAFEKAGSAPYVIIPNEAEVETHNSGSGSGTSYDEFRKANNEEILITILGQTMTTVQGDKGARSLGEVHKEVEEGKNRSDLRFVQRVLNQHVLPMLEARGYPVSGGRFIFPQAAEQLSVADIVQLSDIMDIPQSYLHEKYSIPVPENDEPVAHRSSVPDLSFGEVDEPDDNDDPGSHIQNSDPGLFHRIRDFFVKAPRDGASLGHLPMVLSDPSSLDDRIINSVAAGTSATFSPELFAYISDNLLSAVRSAFKRPMKHADTSYAYGLRDDAFITALEMNLFHFSAAKTLAEIQELNKAFRDSSSYADFEKRAREICCTFNRTWQRTEYETALLTAESASNYHRLRGKMKLFPYWKYLTAGDDRVREEHARLDGVILPANDPRWSKIFPPNGWKCRCHVAGVMRHEAEGINLAQMQRRVDKYLGSSEWESNRAQGWDSNRGDSAEIFNKNQHYIRKFPDKAAKYLGKLYYNDYGLESIGKKAKASTTQLPIYTGDPAVWFASNNIFEDYMGRKLLLKEKVFKFHTTGSHSNRVPLLGCIREVLKNPDEVWLNNYATDNSFNNLNFIKFYDGKAINVICEIKDGSVYQITTWFEIELNAKIKNPSHVSRRIDPRWRYRRGLLIKKS